MAAAAALAKNLCRDDFGGPLVNNLLPSGMMLPSSNPMIFLPGIITELWAPYTTVGRAICPPGYRPFPMVGPSKVTGIR